MGRNPEEATLPRQDVQKDLSWRFAAIVTLAAVLGESLTHLLVQQLSVWMVHAIALGGLAVVSIVFFTWFMRRRRLRAAREAGAEHLLSAAIDEGRRTEHLLQERTELLDQMIQTNLAGIVVHNEDRVITMVNPAFCEIFGYTEEECLGRKVEDLVVPSGERDTFLASVGRGAEGESFRAPTKRRRKDGSLVDVEVLAKRLLVGGKYRGAFAMYLDITKRVEAESALRQSEEVFSTLCASAQVGIFRTDAAGGRIYTNQSMLEMHGLTPEQINSGNPVIGIHPDDVERVMTSREKNLRTKEPFSDHYRYVRPNGEVVWVNVHGGPIIAPDGDLRGFVGVVVDVTSMHEAHEQCVKQKKPPMLLAARSPNSWPT